MTAGDDKTMGDGGGDLKARLFLIAFAAYLVLLTIGVVAEIFDIQSILSWWIWTPPSR